MSTIPAEMTERTGSTGRRGTGLAFGRLLVVMAGIVLGQAVLYGPSLMGRKILLPLDMLEAPYIYIPLATPESTNFVPHDKFLLDLVCQFEPARRFAVSELHAGRFPLWTDYQYAGSPFIWPKFSPFLLLEYCTASPVILAWVQLLCAIVAGLGAYVFFRRVLGVGFWAAVIPSWCYPLTGFFVFWMGFPICTSVYWLPWLLVAVDAVVRRGSLAALAGVGAVTGLVLVSGNIDVAAQVLLTSGLYAAWCWYDGHGKAWRHWKAWRGVALLCAGWGLGLMAAAPQIWPVLEYSQTSARLARRASGSEERPPTGLAALPEMVLPDVWGVTREGHVRMAPLNQLEGADTVYAGIVATLFLAPLAWCSRRHRSMNWFWLGLIVLSSSWSLNIPVIVDMLRMPGLNLMSHNRWIFAASFAILALTAMGLETLWAGRVPWRRWFWAPAGVLACLFVWQIQRAISMPEDFRAQYELAGSQHHLSATLAPERFGQEAHWFAVSSAAAAVWCGLGLGCWVLIRFRAMSGTLAVTGLAAILCGDMLWFARDRCAQCDPALYYPKIPALEQVAKAPAGRVVGFGCLPAMVSQAAGLRDIRGYDTFDPMRLIQLMEMAKNPEYKQFEYALTQWYEPFGAIGPSGLTLSPILDMLNVRYVIFRGKPPATIQPLFASPDYWVLENSRALPRAFVPRHVEVVADEPTRLYRLAASDFDARETAYVENNLELPDVCQGSAEIVSEIPTRVTLAVKMQTAGLVVLGDLWDKGWRAYLDGKAVPIYRTDHALRGVQAPPGNGTLEFRYEPASLAWGLRLAGLSLLTLLFCSVTAFRAKRSQGVNQPWGEPK
jgi:hypothetical protein